MRIIGLLLLFIATIPAQALDLETWQSTHFRDDPSVGKLFTGDGQETTVETLREAVLAADFVLIGEIHTNADHHRLQADIIRILADAGRRPAVVLEMVPQSLQSDLDAYVTIGGDAAGLGAALDWEQRGWPDWAIYRPIAEAALAAELSLVAGNLDRETVQAIGQGDRTALHAAARDRLGLDAPLPDEVEAAILETLAEAHCDLLPTQALAPMLTVQRARDGAMAAAMAEAGDDGAVLIAGRGHVRNDWGVPAILAVKRPDATIVAIGLTEPPHEIGPSPFDFMIVTPRAEVKDYCAELAERFGKPKTDGDSN